MHKNLPLIIALLLPIIFIALASVVFISSKASVKPAHNFIYMSDDGSYYGSYRNTIVLSNDKITLLSNNLDESKSGNPVVKGDHPTLYLYNVKEDTSKQIPLEEAQALTLAQGPSSPDGYTVSYDYGSGGILDLVFASDDKRGYYIAKGANKKRLPALNASYTSYYGFKVIGWVR